jgi:hypothetical protein
MKLLYDTPRKQVNSIVKKRSEEIREKLQRLMINETTFQEIEDLQRELPDVKVQWEGKTYKGQLRPKGDLAKVTLYEVPGTDFESSFSTK